jgi:peptidoglycan/xylan/chitin deacetylase (PgdA/CDA1 family)
VYHNEYLSKKEIVTIYKMGFEIGSHTVNHLDLTRLSDEHIKKELKESKEELEALINDKVVSLSIPYGLWNIRVLKIAKEVGYKYFSVYNFHSKTKIAENIFAARAVYPFESIKVINNRLNNNDLIATTINSLIPHFAKGSSLATKNKNYVKLPLPWFSNK